MSGGVRAEVKKPGKDFWKILVAPKAKWVLHDPNAGNDAARKTATVTVETYDVRTIGKAQVARLRWTHKDSAGESTFGGGQLQPTQVAVTPDGLYLLDEAMDDAAVTTALKKKPARSSPPKPYKGTNRMVGAISSSMVVMSVSARRGSLPTAHAKTCARPRSASPQRTESSASLATTRLAR